MRARIFVPVAFALIAFGLWWGSSDRSTAGETVSPKASTATATTHPAARPVSDPADIFRRVFWKRPGEGDRIVHAERREEKLEDGRSKWRSFLEVEASPALLDYLVKENAFGMRRLAAAEPVVDAPVWFVVEPSTHEAFATPQGSMRVFPAKGGNRLLVVSDATSFSAPAPEVPKPAAEPAETSSGRLPAGPPPGTR